MKIKSLLKYGTIAFLVILASGSLHSAFSNHAKAKQLAHANQTLLILNRTTRGRVATLSADKKELKALLDVQKQLNGRLTAALTLSVPAETVHVAVPVAQTIFDDSARTRTLSVRDTVTSFDVGISIDVIAKDWPAPLELDYSLHIPEFAPKIGFFETGDSYTAVVSWAGHEFDIENAFFKPKRESPLSLNARAEAFMTTTDPVVYGRMYLSLDYEKRKLTYSPRAGWSGAWFFGFETSYKIF